MQRLGLILAWLVVASLATGLTWGVLSSADRHVGEAAATPVLGGGNTEHTAVDVSSTSATTSVAATSSSATSSTAASTGSTTSTSSSTTPTTLTAAPSAWDQSTVPSPGGVVVVGHRPYEVRLESATPAPGFTMEIDKQGFDEVRVEFGNDDVSYEVRVSWEDGVLTTEVD